TAQAPATDSAVPTATGRSSGRILTEAKLLVLLPALRGSGQTVAMAVPSAEAVRDQAQAWYAAHLREDPARFLEPERDTCPWCASSNLSVRIRMGDLIQGKPGEFTLSRCRTCRHVFQNPRLSLEGLEFYYRDFYDGLGQEVMEPVFDGG